MRKSMNITRKPEGGWGELSSPGIFMVFKLNRPIFFIRRLSCAEIFDLSHPEIVFFSERSSVPGARFLHCLVRGAMAEAQWRKREEAEGACAKCSRRKKDREREDVQRRERGKVRTRIQLIGGRRYAQPSDEKGRILNPTRVQMVEWYFHFNFTKEKLPRACREFRRMCASHLRDVEEVQNFGPTGQWCARSRVFPRWPHMAVVSNDVSVKKASSKGAK